MFKQFCKILFFKFYLFASIGLVNMHCHCSQLTSNFKILLGVVLGLDIRLNLTIREDRSFIRLFFFMVKYNYECDYIHLVD